MDRQLIKKILRKAGSLFFRIPYSKRFFIAVLPEYMAEKIFLRLGLPSVKPCLSREGRGVLKRLKDVRNGRV